MVNFTGLALSLAASLLIYLWIYDELSFDKMHQDHELIYRTLTFRKDGTEFVKTPSMPLPLAAYLRDEYPQIQSATFIKFESESPLQVGEKKIEVIPAFVDTHFFEVFSGFRFVEGDIKTSLSKPRSIILSQNTARMIFGNEEALGQTIESNKFSKEVYTVGGVVKIPDHSHIDFGYITLIDNNNYLHRTFTDNWRRSEWSSVYIKLNKNADVSSEFIESVNEYYTRQAGTAKRIVYQPIANIHFFSDYEWRHDRNLGEQKYLLIYGGLAIAIILLAIFNFVLLTIARASERFNEIGYRKIVGASKSQVFMQYISESFVQVLLALIAGLILVYALLPFFNQLTGKSIYFIPSINFTLTTISVAVLISLMAGIYPAFHLSSYNPLLIFKGGNPRGSKNILIKSLITTQSVISIFLLIFTVMIYQQIRFISKKDLGMDQKDIVVVTTGLWYDNEAFKHELLQNSDVLSCSFSTRSPADFYYQHPLTIDGIDTVFTTLFWVDQDFAKTYNIEIVEGQFLNTTNDDYWKATLAKTDSVNGKAKLISIPMVINETAKDMLGLNDPIGQRIGNNVIIGVVKDFNMRPLQHKISPVAMTHNPENIMTLNVKIKPERKSETIAYIRGTYAKHREDRGFSYSYFEDELTALYNSEIRLGNMLVYTTLLAFIISLMGIFSLASYGTQRRRQEIGIRKINGARMQDIMMMLNSDMLRWVVIAFVIAIPISAYFVNQWLNNYAYRTHFNWLLVIIIGVLTILVSFLSISWQCWKASRANPVDTLRYQ
jgi:putative ABC transport system permease protein